MSKKTLTAIGLVIFAAVLISIFIMPVHVVSSPGNGTCCVQTSATCVIDRVVIENKYFLEEGPCP